MIKNYKGYINVVKIPKSSIDKVYTVLGKHPVESIKSLFSRVKPDFAINGGMFSTTNGATVCGLVVDGKAVNTYQPYSKRGFYVLKDGNYSIGAMPKSNLESYIEGSPTLLLNGKIDLTSEHLDYSFINSRHPRTALGIDKDNNLYLVVVDGRKLGKPGINLPNLAKFFLNDLKCVNAINLDGGGSSQLVRNDRGVMRYINSPSENRAVDNYICVNLKTVNPKEVNQQYKTVTASMLNIRAGNGTNFPVIGSYKSGDRVIVLESKNGWSKTDKGWISEKYLK